MGQKDWHNAWDGAVDLPVAARSRKPRTCGLTMVMDKGLGLTETTELLAVAGLYIDYIKLAFGTSALYDSKLLRQKIAAIRSHGVHVYPGGTFLEIAVIQETPEIFLRRAWDLGFTAMEISDGTISMSRDRRNRLIDAARGLGFKVLTEVGKKDPAENPPPGEIAAQIRSDLAAGADTVIVEARESGKGIGIFNKEGAIKKDRFDELLDNIPDNTRILWEAPLKSQQQELILTFGPNVNLGNIPPGETLALEALRLGLRGDTLKLFIKNRCRGCP